jgi:hypothetical protein
VVAGGTSTVFGRLDVWHEFKWVTVSDISKSFGRVDAEVACREMGHWGGRRLVEYEIPKGSGENNFWPFRTACSGDESRMEKCGEREVLNGEGEEAYSHDNDVGIACFLGHDNP